MVIAVLAIVLNAVAMFQFVRVLGLCVHLTMLIERHITVCRFVHLYVLFVCHICV